MRSIDYLLVFERINLVADCLLDMQMHAEFANIFKSMWAES